MPFAAVFWLDGIVSRNGSALVRTGGPKLFCDLTQSWSDVGGGVRTYLLHKQRHLPESTPHSHLWFSPGVPLEFVPDVANSPDTIASPHVQGGTRYRVMVRN